MKKSYGIYDECFNTHVFSLINKDSVCLDVGCWTGNLGKALIQQKNCVVDGVDANPEVLSKARANGYRNTYHIMFDQNNLTVPTKFKYDYIICADVLEHITHPQEVLQNLGQHLQPEGVVIISIPNIAFALQRLLLLFGIFNYSKTGGIMDDSHLRFFTISSAKEMIHNAGFEIMEYHGYSRVRKRFFFLEYLAKLIPSLFAIQLLFVIKVKQKRPDIL